MPRLAFRARFRCERFAIGDKSPERVMPGLLPETALEKQATVGLRTLSPSHAPESVWRTQGRSILPRLSLSYNRSFQPPPGRPAGASVPKSRTRQALDPLARGRAARCKPRSPRVVQPTCQRLPNPRRSVVRLKAKPGRATPSRPSHSFSSRSPPCAIPTVGRSR